MTWALEVRDARYPEARVMGGYEPTSMGARNSGPLQEQCVLLTTGPSLQSLKRGLFHLQQGFKDLLSTVSQGTSAYFSVLRNIKYWLRKGTAQESDLRRVSEVN